MHPRLPPPFPAGLILAPGTTSAPLMALRRWPSGPILTSLALGSIVWLFPDYLAHRLTVMVGLLDV